MIGRIGAASAVLVGLWLAFVVAHHGNHDGHQAAAAAHAAAAAGSAILNIVEVILGAAVFTALAILAAVVIRRRAMAPMVIEDVAPEPVAAQPVVERWHCLLEAVTEGGDRILLKRGPVPYPAVSAQAVQNEVIRRFVAAYPDQLPAGARLSCRAAPMPRHSPERDRVSTPAG